MSKIEAHVGMLLRSIAHRDVNKLYAVAVQHGLPYGNTESSTFYIVLAALVRYLSERTTFEPRDLVGPAGHDALHALVPVIFECAEWWRDPTTGSAYAWFELQLRGPNASAWQQIWKEML